MKKGYWFVALCLSANIVWASPAAVEKQVERLTEAMVQADAATLKSVTHSQLDYGHSSGRVETQQEFIEGLTSGASDFVKIDLQEQKITVSDDVAVVRHNLIAETNDSGKPGTVKIGVLLVWQQVDGEWKLLARQAYKI